MADTLPASLRRHLLFAAAVLASIFLFLDPLRRWAALSLSDDRYSHLVLIPFLSAGFLFAGRKHIFGRAAFRARFGILLAAAVAVYAFIASGLVRPSAEISLTVTLLAIILVWTVAFALCYGPEALRAAKFPLLLLLLMVPVPSGPMDYAIGILQQGSAYGSEQFFRTAGVPMFRHGFTFELPVVWIEVAAECSSIHSSWALFITGIIVAHLALKSLWTKTVLAVLTVPIAMFTNSIRIVTIWGLSAYVNRGFMYGDLHRRGGIAFSLISLAILAGFLVLLRKLERKRQPARELAAEAATLA